MGPSGSSSSFTKNCIARNGLKCHETQFRQKYVCCCRLSGDILRKEVLDHKGKNTIDFQRIWAYRVEQNLGKLWAVIIAWGGPIMTSCKPLVNIHSPKLGDGFSCGCGSMSPYAWNPVPVTIYLEHSICHHTSVVIYLPPYTYHHTPVANTRVTSTSKRVKGSSLLVGWTITSRVFVVPGHDRRCHSGSVIF